MKKVLTVVVILLSTMLVIGCVPSANRLAGPPETDEDVAGFWRGLWHGLIMPFTFIISLFSDQVGMYEVNNTGGWYDFGFLLGAMVTLGGSSGGASCRSRKRR